MEKDKNSIAYWNYRLLERTIMMTKEEQDYFNEIYNKLFKEDCDSDLLKEETAYELIEVYYNPDGEMVAWVDTPVTVMGSSIQELKTLTKQIKRAYKRKTVKLVENKLVETDRRCVRRNLW